jgi:large subunit ribosomal protein L17e
MHRYSKTGVNTSRTACAKGADLRVHFKNTAETAAAVRNMNVDKAIAYLEAVMDHKRCIPFLRFNGGVGRTAQAKNEGNSIGQGRWPKKSCQYVMDLLKNAKANAEKKGLDTDNLVIVHAQVNQAPRGRRRTYRAHGRINAYMSSPSHIEVIVEDKSGDVPAAIEDSKVRKLSKVQRARALRSGATSA